MSLWFSFYYRKTIGDCPTLELADNLSQSQLLERLTHSCRYDRLERPKGKFMAFAALDEVSVSYLYFPLFVLGDNKPVEVSCARIFTLYKTWKRMISWVNLPLIILIAVKANLLTIHFITHIWFSLQQFKIHILVQLRYVDARLAFKNIAPSRTDPIVGESSFMSRLWFPHLFLANEK